MGYLMELGEQDNPFANMHFTMSYFGKVMNYNVL